MLKVGFGYDDPATTPEPSDWSLFGSGVHNSSELSGEFVAFTDFGPDGSMDTSPSEHAADEADANLGAPSFDGDLSEILTTDGQNDTELTGEFVAF